MFNKLRMRLTFTNVVVVSIILVLFMLSTVVVMEKIAHDQTNQLISLISSDAGLDNMPSKPGHRNHDGEQFRYFYVKLSPTGEILSGSQGLDIQNNHIRDMISNAFSSSKRNGRIEDGDVDYRFIRGKVQNSNQISILFVNTHSESEIPETLITVLLVTGILGLVLAFFGSLFMANRSLIPIKEAWKRQKDFVADASHELRTPLSVIETTLDLLIGRKQYTIESQIKWLENIQTESKRMTKLVGDMLFLARTDSEQVMLEMKTFSLSSSLLEAYIPFEALAVQKGLHLRPFHGPEMTIWGDEARVKQLVVILVDNAIQHTPSGGYIGLQLKDSSDSAEIIVSDTGTGIEKEYQEKIFERFFRVDKSRSRKDGNVGLGLSIADWIAREHHGSIRIESAVGKGTTFTIVLPKRNE